MLLDESKRKELLEKYPSMFSRLLVTGFPVNILLKKSALLVGAGGLGVIIAEILARSGIGKLIIVDRDVVTPENFNRLGYSWEDVNKPKAKALAEKLEKLRNIDNMPEQFRIKIESFHEDIIGWERLEEIIKSVDIVFSALDNDIARRELNFVAMTNKKPMINGGTSFDGFSGTVMVIIPNKTPCYECYYKNAIRVSTYKKIAGCDASIATTMTMVGVIMVDQGLRILLDMKGIIPLMKIYMDEGIEIVKIRDLKPNPNCPVCKLIR